MKSKGTDRATQVDAVLSAAGLDVLGAMRTGIVCVLPDWTIAAVNDAAAEALALGTARHVGADFWTAFPALHDGRGHDQIMATMRDGAARVFHASLPGGPADAIQEVRVSRTRGGWLVFELREPIHHVREAPADEADPFRVLAHEMAAGSDSEALLSVVCDAAVEICGAEGASVGRVVGHDGIIVATAGAHAPAPGTVFPLADSVAAAALRSRELVVERADRVRGLITPEVTQAGALGEVAVAPLVAADQPVGVLAAWRGAQASSFSPRDRQRLRVIADHAAVVLVKARLLEEAQAATLAKSNFLATISHELRTPLTALTGYGELLADEILGPLATHQRDIIERMRSVTHQLAVMVDELLTFSSIEAGREAVRPADVFVAEILDGVAATIEPLARQKDLQFSVVLPPDVSRVFTDPDKVRQILVNLAGNAVKFTDRGRVGVSVAKRNDELWIDVHDTGVGIRASDFPRLFQPFTQLDAGLTRRHGGTGLGLYNSLRLAQLLGGRIAVESELGKGSTFSLVIPIRYSEKA